MASETWKYKTLNDIRTDIKARGYDLNASENTEVLAEAICKDGLSIPNRLAIHPMEGCDAELDGSPGELTFRRYRAFAEGGAGLIWFEAVAAVPEGRNFPNQLWINKSNLDSYKRIAHDINDTHIKKFGVKPFVVAQLTHSGRFSKQTGKPDPHMPVHDPYLETKHPYCKDFDPVDDAYLEQLEDEYVAAALLLQEAGFDAIDLKCCHKYLVSELLGSFTREGRYGGTFENRSRFLVNIFKKSHEALGDSFPLAARMNIYDKIPYPYGFGVDRHDVNKPDFTEPIELIRILRSYGLRIVNCTMSSPYYEPHVNRPYSKGTYVPDEHPLTGVDRLINGIAQVQRAFEDLCIVGTGYSWFREYAPYFAASGVETGKSTMAGFGRASFAFPGMFERVLSGKKLDSRKVCVACSKCAELLRSGKPAGCVVRDSEVYVPIYKTLKKG